MRKMAIRKLTGAALLLAAALAVAGCGGGSKSSTPAPPTVTVGATTTTEAPPTTTTTGSGSFSLKDCASLATFSQDFAKALADASGSGISGLGAQADTFKAFAAKAPAEIRDQLQILGDAVAKAADALKGVNLATGQVPTAGVLLKLQAAGKALSAPEVAAAGQKFQAYVQAHCHA